MSIPAFRVLILVLIMSGLAGPALADCKISVIAELPVVMSHNKALASVAIDGHPQQMAVDSGMFYSTLTPSTAAEQKLHLESLPWSMRIVGIGGTADAEATTVRTFTLAGVPLHNMEFVVTSGAPAGVAGYIGQNILGLDDVEYDLGEGFVRLMHGAGCGSADMAYWSAQTSSSVPIEVIDDHDPHTLGTAQINGHRIEVMFDTGAGASVLTRAAAERIGIDLKGPDVRPIGWSYGFGEHPVTTWAVKVASFKLGDEEIRNAELQVMDSDLPGADMLLGADFFLSHRVYVSNRQRRLYFTYSGGTVFNTGGKPTMTQDGPNGALHEATLPTDLGPEPTDAAGYGRRGAALLARGDATRALADINHAIQLDPKDASYLVQRAGIELQLGQGAPAAADLDQALSLAPDLSIARLQRARLRQVRRDRAGAQADLDYVAANAPKPDDVRLELGQAYLALAEPAQAIPQFDLWAAAHDGDGRMFQAQSGRCEARALIGADLDRALHDCDHALGARPNGPVILQNRGLVELRMGRYDKAVSDYDTALTQMPKLAWALYGRGLAELDLGKTDAGRADIAAALALRPRLAEEAKAYGIAEGSGPAAAPPAMQAQQ